MNISSIGFSPAASYLATSKKKTTYQDVAKELVKNYNKADASIHFLRNNFLSKTTTKGIDLYSFTMALYRATPENKAEGLLQQKYSTQNPFLDLFA